MSWKIRTAAVATMALSGFAGTAEAETRFLQQPDISADRLAFVYGGDIWISARDGSDPRRLTSDPAREEQPHFSPDGDWIAFSAEYNGNWDVYVMPAAGGAPKRLTWHPGSDVVRGWTPEGEVIFVTSRAVNSRGGEQLFTVSPDDGGLPQRLPMPQAFDGAVSPDGSRIAYQVFRPAQIGASGWKKHRGGTTPPIWIYDVASGDVTEIPHDRVNDTYPMWVGDTVYFLSDRNDIVNLFAYGPDGSVNQLTRHADWDIDTAGAGPDAIAYEAGGRIHVYDIAGGDSRALEIDIAFDAPQAQVAWKDASKAITGQAISPTGQRVAFAGRGDIFTVPVEDGDTRNLTGTDGVNDRDPVWSPDGQRLAWLSDDGEGMDLIIADQRGVGARRTIALPDGPYYYLRGWSPDGATIAYEDNHLNLYALDLESGESTRIGAHSYRISGADFEPAFSPDGRWIAFAETQPNYFRVLKLHNLDSGETHRVTEGLAEIGSPVFSRDGKHLFFTGSTNFGPRTVFLDMSTQDRPLRRGIYALVLAADGETPLPPKTGDEPEKAETAGEKEPGEGEDDANGGLPATRIDLDGLAGRMVALSVASADYAGLAVAKDGALFYLDRRQPGSVDEPPAESDPAAHSLIRFDFDKRAAATVLDAQAAGFTISGDGSKLLVQGKRRQWQVRDAAANGGEPKSLSLSGLRMRVDPRAEWRQIFRDVWRMEKEFFYAENMHGLDWDAIRAQYEPLVEHVSTREELNTLLVEMIGELQVGHNRLFGGDSYSPERVQVGLLGADYSLENGRYRVATLYDGETWTPFVKGPLAAPGHGVAEGEYILAIDGEELTAADNIHAMLEGKAGKQVILTVGDSPAMEGARQVTVTPVADEDDLRLWHWIEENRKRVAAATDGRVGYIYLPNTAGAGYTLFNRYFFSQVDKEALIIDERFNGGGQAANYIVEVLNRAYLSSWKDRDGRLFTTPAGVFPGPKTMLINQYAGSGGDYLPWSFRRLELGKLIGTRTWGGLIGISANPPLIDGGRLTVPYFRFITPEGEYRVENEGVGPDIEVRQTPKAVNAGADPQLDRAIEEMLTALEDYDSPLLDTHPPLPTELGK